VQRLSSEELGRAQVLEVIMHDVAENPALEADPLESLERVPSARAR
jgi:hypothetical protein